MTNRSRSRPPPRRAAPHPAARTGRVKVAAGTRAETKAKTRARKAHQRRSAKKSNAIRERRAVSPPVIASLRAATARERDSSTAPLRSRLVGYQPHTAYVRPAADPDLQGRVP